MRKLLVAVLLCFGLGGSLWAQGAGSSVSADKAAVAFYQWYLRQFAANEIPLNHPKGEIRLYVAPELVRELRRDRHPEEDYFLKAQDTLEDWEANVRASVPVVAGAAAKTTVTLGGSPKTEHVVVVRMVRSGGRWKVRGVRGGSN